MPAPRSKPLFAWEPPRSSSWALLLLRASIVHPTARRVLFGRSSCCSWPRRSPGWSSRWCGRPRDESRPVGRPHDARRTRDRRCAATSSAACGRSRRSPTCTDTSPRSSSRGCTAAPSSTRCSCPGPVAGSHAGIASACSSSATTARGTRASSGGGRRALARTARRRCDSGAGYVRVPGAHRRHGAPVQGRARPQRARACARGIAEGLTPQIVPSESPPPWNALRPVASTGRPPPRLAARRGRRARWSMSSARTCEIEVVEHRPGECAGLGEHADAVLEGHDRRDRRDVHRGRELLLGLGVDLRERQVGVRLGGSLVVGCELQARTAPSGPEVDEDGAAFEDGLLEVRQG